MAQGFLHRFHEKYTTYDDWMAGLA